MKREVELGEYRSLTVPGLRPSRADLAVTAELAALPGADRPRLRWLAGDRLEITTGPDVGVIDLDGIRIRIVPKLVGGELNVLRMIDQARGLASLEQLAAHRDLPAEGLHLRDLICLLVATTCERILRHGPRRDYTRHEDDLPVLRGRLLADRQVLRRYGRLDRLECRYETLDADILDNQLCATAVDRAARIASDPGVRALARRTASDFATVCPARPLRPAQVRPRLHYQRHNEHYRPAHHWSLVLLGSAGLDDLYSTSLAGGRTFLINMNTLFEDYATALVREAAAGTGIAVRDQIGHSGVLRDESTGRSYSRVVPDLLLEREEWRRPVDVKYKRYDDRKISTADLYQAFLYGYALSTDEVPAAGLLHPAETAGPPVRLTVRRLAGEIGATVTAVGVDIPRLLDLPPSPERAAALADLLALLTCPTPSATRFR